MVKPKKYLGQHFLTDKNIASKIVQALKNTQNNDVLEIGPGTGILTNELLNKNYSLTLIEIDKESIDYLKQNFKNQFNLLEGDFLKINLQEIFYSEISIIGNFPYNISSQIFFKILNNMNMVSEVVCMIQKEVAERITSKHGNKIYGILSVLIQYYYDVEYLFTVNETVFFPAPKVKSAVIRLSKKKLENENIPFNTLLTIVKTAFNQRRKKIGNSLSQLIKLNNLDNNNPFFSLRPEQLSPSDFATLSGLFSLIH